MKILVLGDPAEVDNNQQQAAIGRYGSFRILAETGRELHTLNQIENFDPEIVIFDAHLPNLSVKEIVRRAILNTASLRIIAVRMCAETYWILEQLETRVMAYPIKASECDELIDAIGGLRTGKLIPASISFWDIHRTV